MKNVKRLNEENNKIIITFNLTENELISDDNYISLAFRPKDYYSFCFA